MKWSGDNAIDIPYDEGNHQGNLGVVVYLTIQPSYRALFEITFTHYIAKGEAIPWRMLHTRKFGMRWSMGGLPPQA